ncbi:hypothetical protein A0056_004265 [Campylobacter jejuni]|nr:hypothetical protein A0056_004265 [Campylobacter jejuni]SUX00444.1 Uncharacterised protein [Campylobacter jejuni subsp. doylei]
MKKILILILVCFSLVRAYNIEELVSADNIEEEVIYKFLKCSHGDVNSCKKDYQNFLAWFKQKDQIVYELTYNPLFGCDRNYLLDMKTDIEKAIRITFLKQAKLYEWGKDPLPDINISMTCNKSYNLDEKLIAGLVTLEFRSIINYLITRDVNLSYLDKWRDIKDEQIYVILGNDTSDLKGTIEDSITYFNNIITSTAKAINQ